MHDGTCKMTNNGTLASGDRDIIKDFKKREKTEDTDFKNAADRRGGVFKRVSIEPVKSVSLPVKL